MRNPGLEQFVEKAVSAFFDTHPGCRVDTLTGGKFLVALGDPQEDGFLEGQRGFFDLHYRGVDMPTRPLETEQDVRIMIALCEALLRGCAVMLSGPGGYPARTYVFTEEYGVQTSTSLRCFGRRARNIPKAAWRRERIAPLEGSAVE